MMAGGLGGGAAGGGGPSGPAFEDTHDFSSSTTYNIPAEEQDTSRVWEIKNEGGGVSDPTWFADRTGGEGPTISYTGFFPISESLFVGSRADLLTISANNTAAEIQTTIRAYDIPPE